MTKLYKRTNNTISPAWQAKLDGKITVEDYNRIISKKVTLEEVLESYNKKSEEDKAMDKLFWDESVSDAEYYAVLNNKLSIGRLKKIRSYIKCYSKKIGLELQGNELANADNVETLYNDFMSYYHNNTGKLASLCARTANLIADYQQTVFC